MSPPVKRSDKLVLDARLTAEAAERSIAGRLEGVKAAKRRLPRSISVRWSWR